MDGDRLVNAIARALAIEDGYTDPEVLMTFPRGTRPVWHDYIWQAGTAARAALAAIEAEGYALLKLPDGLTQIRSYTGDGTASP